MKEENQEDLGKDKDLQLEIMNLDLNSLQSVVKFADEFKQTGYQLNLLICNAGIAAVPKGETDQASPSNSTATNESTIGARATSDISSQFEITPKFDVLMFKMYSTDRNKILHTSRQLQSWHVQNFVVIGCAHLFDRIRSKYL